VIFITKEAILTRFMLANPAHLFYDEKNDRGAVSRPLLIMQITLTTVKPV
jgi:hypothetical protein